MKTLMLYEPNGCGTFYVELEGDYSRLNNIYLGDNEITDLHRELENIIWDDSEEILDIKVKKLQIPTKDWDIYVRCGDRW